MKIDSTQIYGSAREKILEPSRSSAYVLILCEWRLRKNEWRLSFLPMECINKHGERHPKK